MSCPLCVCPAAGHPPHMWSPWSGSGRPLTSLGLELCPWSETEKVRAFYPRFQVFGYPTHIRWWPHHGRSREIEGGFWRRPTQNSVYCCACSCCGVTFSLGDLRSSAWRTWTWTGLGRWLRCIDWRCSRTESPGNQSSRTWKLTKRRFYRLCKVQIWCKSANFINKHMIILQVTCVLGKNIGKSVNVFLLKLIPNTNNLIQYVV